MMGLTSSSERVPKNWALKLGRGLFVALALTLAGAGWPSEAFAQGKVITISEVTIVGRVQKPIAAVDVSRIQPQMTLAELRQPFLDRIEKAIYRAPF